MVKSHGFWITEKILMQGADFAPFRPSVKPNTFLRDLPYSILHSIAMQLDPDGSSTTWRDLALKIPHGRTNPNPRFNNNDIQHFELCCRQGKSATLMMLSAWSTSNPTAQDLVDVLHNLRLPKLANMILPSEDRLDLVPQSSGKFQMQLLSSYKENINIEKEPAVAPYSEATHNETVCSQNLKISKRHPIEHESIPYRPNSAITNVTDHLSLESLSSATRNLSSFNYLDLIELTSNFNDSCKIGEGAFGSVFSGHLYLPHQILKQSDTRKIAVKRLKLDTPELIDAVTEQFEKEIHIISELEHCNLLPLIGYSCDGPELCLVYDFMVNGSLSSKLESCRYHVLLLGFCPVLKFTDLTSLMPNIISTSKCNVQYKEMVKFDESLLPYSYQKKASRTCLQLITGISEFLEFSH